MDTNCGYYHLVTHQRLPLSCRYSRGMAVHISLTNNRIVREGPGPRGIWGRVRGVGLVQGVTRSGLVCDSPSARSAVAREARFSIEYYFIEN